MPHLTRDKVIAILEAEIQAAHVRRLSCDRVQALIAALDAFKASDFEVMHWHQDGPGI